MGAGQLRQRLRSGSGLRDLIEDDLSVLVETVNRGIVDDLANGLLDPGLGQVTRQEPIPVRLHHRGLEPHGEGELGHHHPQEGHHERDGYEGEAALIATGAVLHCAFTRIGTTKAGSSSSRPLIIARTVTSTAWGKERSSTASQDSSHAPASRW